jgi:hypothetical protein
MLVGTVVEGDTEYYCLPKLLAKLGHESLRPLSINGSSGHWPELVRQRVVPRVRSLKLKNPGKILVVLDRETRPECSPELARQALDLIMVETAHEGACCPIAVIIADRYFECVLFADYEALHSLEIARTPGEVLFGTGTDSKNVLAIIKGDLRPNATYHKTKHGPCLAKQIRLDNPVVLSRSRSLRKLVKEVPPIHTDAQMKLE